MEEKKFLLAAIVVAVLVLAGSAGWVYWSGGKAGQIKKTEPVQTAPFLREEERGEKKAGEAGMPVGTSPTAVPVSEKESPKFTLKDGYGLALEEARKWDENAYLGGINLVFPSRDAEPGMRFYFASGMKEKEILAVLVQEGKVETTDKLEKKNVVGIPLEKTRVIQIEEVEKINVEKVLSLGDANGGKTFAEKTIVAQAGIPSFLTMQDKGLWRLVYGTKELVLIVNPGTGKVEKEVD